jgi:uroporphyrinogen decarboxylase
MTEKKMLRVLQGEAVWPPPIWLMRQAGRYLPEYREVRAKAGDFLSLCMAPALAAEVTLQPLRRFGMDAAILFSDILVLPWALGQGLRYAEGEGPQLPPIRDSAGLAKLDSSRLASAVAPVMETVRRVRAEVGDAALIGFAGSPFTVACYMIEGHGSKDFSAVRTMAYQQLDLFQKLMDIVTDATVEYLFLQIRAGAEVVMLFDSWSGVLSPRMFRAHVTGASARIVAALRARCRENGLPEVPVIGFPRLGGTMIRDYAATTKVDAVGIDTAADLTEAAKLVSPRVALQGNLDPLAVVAGGDAMAEETDAILAAMHGRPHIFNLGHGIVVGTPPAHVGALVARVHAA